MSEVAGGEEGKRYTNWKRGRKGRLRRKKIQKNKGGEEKYKDIAGIYVMRIFFYFYFYFRE